MAETTINFKNESGLTFTDISSESYRAYFWADSMLKIERPLMLHVSESGGHRVFAEGGKSFYVKPGWRYIQWEALEGKPNFVK